MVALWSQHVKQPVRDKQSMCVIWQNILWECVEAQSSYIESAGTEDHNNIIGDAKFWRFATRVLHEKKAKTTTKATAKSEKNTILKRMEN